MEEIERKIQDELSTIEIYKKFISLVNKLEDEEIKEQGGLNKMLVYDNGEMYFTLDYVTLPALTQTVLENHNLIPKPSYKIFNYHVRKGKDACVNYLETEISSLFRVVQALTFTRDSICRN